MNIFAIMLLNLPGIKDSVMLNLNKKTAIIIPIRMASTRLPGKFHALIDEKPMIHHVIDRARESGFTNIFVACDHDDHFEIVSNYGVKAILTSIDHQSGSDRVFEALCYIDPECKFEYVINLQGDMPFFDPEVIARSVKKLADDEKADLTTIVVPLDDEEDINNPNAVKVVFNKNNHALYFSRHPIPYFNPKTINRYYYHLGIYAYKRDALEKYINLPQSALELSERLEQLRALENGMVIAVDIAEEIPISVDTPEDLEYARNYVKKTTL